VTLLSAGTDGTDGPTNVAGGIVDGCTAERIRRAGFDPAAELRKHNSNPVLTALEDTIITGSTGNNVRDLRVIYIGKAQS
jgi:glycerate-2-kinase